MRAAALLLSLVLTMGVLACAADRHAGEGADVEHAKDCLPLAVAVLTLELSLVGPIGRVDLPTSVARLTLRLPPISPPPERPA
jgi:hypothetical protein